MRRQYGRIELTAWSGLDEGDYSGWLQHQLGPGDNLALRRLMMERDLNDLEVFGERQDDFEDSAGDH